MPCIDQCFSNLCDASVQRVIRDKRVRPDGADEIVLPDEMSTPFDEEDQYLELLPSELDLPTCPQEAASIQVQNQIPCQVRAMGRCRHARLRTRARARMGGVLEEIDTAGTHIATDVGLSSGFRRRFFRTSDTDRLYSGAARILHVTETFESLALGGQGGQHGRHQVREIQPARPSAHTCAGFVYGCDSHNTGRHGLGSSWTRRGEDHRRCVVQHCDPDRDSAVRGSRTFSADGGIVNTTSLSLGTLESPGHGRWVRTGSEPTT